MTCFHATFRQSDFLSRRKLAAAAWQKDVRADTLEKPLLRTQTCRDILEPSTLFDFRLLTRSYLV